MKKYCCDSFRFRHDGASSMGLNFRIIRLSQPFIERSQYKGNIYRYLITEGYLVLNESVKVIFMEYCPYCGKELKRIYNSNNYINEFNHPY
jgi:hypothetical protein